MNCRPGDLAVIVAGDMPDNFGKLVRVIGVGPRSEPGEWLIEPLCSLLVELDDGTWGSAQPGDGHIYAFDCDLRPIRDPGEDARDETLDWLPSPFKQTEPA